MIEAIQKSLWVVPAGVAFMIWFLGAFGVRMRQRGYPIEEQHPVLYRKGMKIIATAFYSLLFLSIPIILIFTQWNLTGIHFFYLALLPWILYIRIKTWKDKSSLLNYRFFTSSGARYLGIWIPLVAFSVLSILELIIVIVYN